MPPGGRRRGALRPLAPNTTKPNGATTMDNLLIKYRPRSLDGIHGQDEVVQALRLFLKAPYSTAMIFHGDTGVGKSAAALALAHELGIAVEEEELGGFGEIASGEMDGLAVRRHLDRLRLGTLFGSGWKMLVCNEADRMTQ